MKSDIVNDICGLFRIASVRAVAQAFAAELQMALQGQGSSLKILPSYLSRPSGREQGQFIAIDFGGTNVRVMKVSLLGRGGVEIVAQSSRPLADAANGYDLTSSASTGRELFNFVARLIEEVQPAQQDYALGLTFSYPMQQEAVDKAILLEWTKEIKTSQTVGQDIKKLLSSALKEHGLGHIVPTAIINDTVATFMAKAYAEAAVWVGSICGTGHNTCYLEPSRCTAAGQPMIVNTEAGNFALLNQNRYDQLLDCQSLDPGRQRLEKMVSGKYMGELFRLVVLDLVEGGLLAASFNDAVPMKQAYAISAEVLNWLSTDSGRQHQELRNWLDEQGFSGCRAADLDMLRMVAQAIMDRAAKLIAATYIAITDQIRHSPQQHIIAVDGSVFMKIPGFLEKVEMVVRQNREGLPTVVLRPASNGSNLGAAVAAAQACRFS